MLHFVLACLVDSQERIHLPQQSHHSDTWMHKTTQSGVLLMDVVFGNILHSILVLFVRMA